MADNEEKSSIPWLPLITFIAVSSGVLLYFQQLTSSRPGGGDPTLADKTFDSQTIDARLWQDPVAVTIGDSEVTNAKGTKRRDEGRHRVDEFRSVFLRQWFGDTDKLNQALVAADPDSVGYHLERLLVLGVMIPGGPYVEDVERRLRSRRAVIEALGSGWRKQTYNPEKDHEIGYFCIPWLRAEPTSESAVKVLQENRRMWQAWSSETLVQYCGIAYSGSVNCVMRVPCSSGEDADALVVPYEWFEPQTSDGQRNSFNHILVLWLIDDAFTDAPLARLADFVSWFELKSSCGRSRRELMVPTFRVLGPDNSGTLRRMVLEAKKQDWDTDTRECLGAVHMYSNQASAAESQLLADAFSTEDLGGQADCKSLLEVSVNLQQPISDFRFDRTNLPDDHVVAALQQELRLHGVAEKDHVAIISEEDTFHARALASSFVQENASAASPFVVSRYTYLRGIDGKLPSDKTDKDGASYERENNNGNQNGKNNPATRRPTEQTEGVNQADDIRRLADRLRIEDEKCQAAGRARLKAIGLLGSDVYDKLELLKALRPIFPDAIFFTNHLEARFAHPDEWKETHNLLIASDYDLFLEAPANRQNGSDAQIVGPFRDSGQTALYEATLEAIGATTSDFARPRSPLIYEVGRNGFARLGVPNQTIREYLIPLALIFGAAVVASLLFGWIWSVSRVTLPAETEK